MRVFTLSLIVVISILPGCKKGNPEAVDLGYRYFPDETGSYIIYRVDSIHYGITQESFSFELKELLADQFIDGQGDAATRVERYVRLTADDPWILRNVWVQKRTTRSAHRVEDNIRYVRLAFPVEAGKLWNGNSFNTLGSETYQIRDSEVARTFGNLSFSKTLRVDQRNRVNLVDQKIAFEIYGYDVGLIYRQFKDVVNQSGQLSGAEYQLTVIEYGKE